VAPGRNLADTPAFQPEQALDLATILTAYTAGSAYLNRRDATTGRIEVGLDADLAVLDRDPFTGPPAAIASTRVIATYVGGDPVYVAD
jgi:predicted amidohydrolase YtcJ